jgi:hypothetical protein
VCRAEQLKAKRQSRGAPTASQESVMADAHETLRKDVQQETPQELVDRQGSELLLIVVRGIAPAKSNLVILERDQAMVGDGHAMGVAAEIVQHVSGTTEGPF